MGLGAAPPVAQAMDVPAYRSTVLRAQRTDPGSVVVQPRDTDSVSPPRGEGEDPAPICPSPVAPRSRGRDGARGRAPECDPAPARSPGSRRHLGLSPGNR